MLYYVKNKSGNISDVTKEIYERLKDNDSYEVWTEDPYKDLPPEVTGMIGSSSDYTISELENIRENYTDQEWAEFTEGDTRKTLPE